MEVTFSVGFAQLSGKSNINWQQKKQYTWLDWLLDHGRNAENKKTPGKVHFQQKNWNKWLCHGWFTTKTNTKNKKLQEQVLYTFSRKKPVNAGKKKSGTGDNRLIAYNHGNKRREEKQPWTSTLSTENYSKRREEKKSGTGDFTDLTLTGCLTTEDKITQSKNQVHLQQKKRLTQRRQNQVHVTGLVAWSRKQTQSRKNRTSTPSAVSWLLKPMPYIVNGLSTVRRILQHWFSLNEKSGWTGVSRGQTASLKL